MKHPSHHAKNSSRLLSMALVASLTITSGTLALLVSESALADDNLQASQAGATLTAQDAHDIARDTYVYAFPMVLAEVTRRVMTNVEAPVSVGLGHAPMNQFGHMLTFPTENTTDVARPNADTLYSSLWFTFECSCPKGAQGRTPTSARIAVLRSRDIDFKNDSKVVSRNDYTLVSVNINLRRHRFSSITS